MAEPIPEVAADGSAAETEEPNTLNDGDLSDHQPPRKRQRIRLSCLECRRRKLSCDRGFPCERCIKSGTPDRCAFETKSGAVVNASSGVPSAFTQLDSRRNGDFSPAGRDSDGGSVIHSSSSFRDYDRIRKLELEVQNLKNQLLRHAGSSSLDGSTVAATNSPLTQKDEAPEESPTRAVIDDCFVHVCPDSDKNELRFFRGKEFRTRYFGPHNASLAFLELTGLCPFMKETSAEWLKPARIVDRKDRKKRKEDREKTYLEPDPHLESLLPPREEVDAIVAVYLDQFEQLHRIVHIPTFRREYETFWEPGSPSRYAAFTALVLAILAVASCSHGESAASVCRPSSRFVGMISSSHQAAERWIQEVEAWSAKQSAKHRRLIHYQIACLLYLGKRVNAIKKKRFWTGAGALIQDGISVGLHREPSLVSSGRISVYNQEMRRRIWATMLEFDMQASMDHGLPTLASQLHFDVHPPRNLDDEDFDEDTTELPPSQPSRIYTFSSYQHLAHQSLPLRLELSRILCGPPGDIDYDQVIRYTNDLTHEIDALPSWDTSPTNTAGTKKPLLVYTLLHIQLRQYIIPLHQPYLKLRKSNPKYQYSEIIYYNAARDIVLLHEKLFEQGILSLNFLREDALTAAINLCSVTMLQPRGSTNMIMINSQHTVKLLEKCLAMKEDRLLRCGNNEPWGYSILCSAHGLLEAHLGTKTPEQAKASSAERFITLHYSLLANQEPPFSSSQQSEGTSNQQNGGSTMVNQRGATPMDIPARPKSVTPFSFSCLPGQTPTPLDGSAMSWFTEQQSDFGLEALGLNINELWAESWDMT